MMLIKSLMYALMTALLACSPLIHAAATNPRAIRAAYYEEKEKKLEHPLCTLINLPTTDEECLQQIQGALEQGLSPYCVKDIFVDEDGKLHQLSDEHGQFHFVSNIRPHIARHLPALLRQAQDVWWQNYVTFPSLATVLLKHFRVIASKQGHRTAESIISSQRLPLDFLPDFEHLIASTDLMIKNYDAHLRTSRFATLIRHSANPDTVLSSTAIALGCNYLHHAATDLHNRTNPTEVKSLCHRMQHAHKAGIDFYQQNICGDTPLHTLWQNSHPRSRILWPLFKDITEQKGERRFGTICNNDNITPLHLAIYHYGNYPKFIRKAIVGEDLNSKYTFDNTSEHDLDDFCVKLPVRILDLAIHRTFYNMERSKGWLETLSVLHQAGAKTTKGRFQSWSSYFNALTPGKKMDKKNEDVHNLIKSIKGTLTAKIKQRQL